MVVGYCGRVYRVPIEFGDHRGQLRMPQLERPVHERPDIAVESGTEVQEVFELRRAWVAAI